MKVHRFKNDPQVLLEQGKAIVKSTPEGRYIQRVVLVNILLTGELGTKELSEISGTPVRTLQCWLKDVDEKGWDTLLDPVRPGRASRLTGEDKKKIKDLITEDNPSAYGYDVWDAKTLADYIRNAFGIAYGQSAATKLLHSLGFSLIRPTTHPAPDTPNPEAEENYKKNKRCDGKSQTDIVFRRRGSFTVATQRYPEMVS